ncbi:ATP-binding cassette domain-containing protein [Nocardiopsis coralliicola]
MSPVLAVSGLRIAAGGRTVVDGLDLDLYPGEVTALVGRSGSGKSLTALALLGLLPDGAAASGSAVYAPPGGVPADLLALPERDRERVRGAGIGLVFQDAQASLNPTLTVRRHFTETLAAHGVPRRARADRGRRALLAAGLADPDGMLAAYPFELSGGQAQRVAVALARAAGPCVLIADEATSHLDPVAQAAVLDTLRADAAGAGGQDRAAGRAVLLITHDLAVAGRWADRVAVLDGGRIVEAGPVQRLLGAPAHPFTAALVRASGAAR